MVLFLCESYWEFSLSELETIPQALLCTDTDDYCSLGNVSQFCSHWNQWSRMKIGCNPILEWLHCFQWKRNRKRHLRVVAALTLTLGVNRRSVRYVWPPSTQCVMGCCFCLVKCACFLLLDSVTETAVLVRKIFPMYFIKACCEREIQWWEIHGVGQQWCPG